VELKAALDLGGPRPALVDDPGQLLRPEALSTVGFRLARVPPQLGELSVLEAVAEVRAAALALQSALDGAALDSSVLADLADLAAAPGDPAAWAGLAAGLPALIDLAPTPARASLSALHSAAAAVGTPPSARDLAVGAAALRAAAAALIP